MATLIALGSEGGRYEEWHGKLVQVAHRILGDYHLAEDVVHEVMLAWHQSGGCDSHGKPVGKGWLVNAAKNQARTVLQKRARAAEIERLRESPLFHDIDPSRVIELKDLYLKVHFRFSRLKPRVAREVIRLRIQEGLGYDQICERLGITSGNARLHVFRGLEALRNLLEADGTDKLIREILQ